MSICTEVGGGVENNQVQVQIFMHVGWIFLGECEGVGENIIWN